MQIKFRNLIIHAVFLLMSFWDILDDIFPKLPLLILAIILFACVIKGYLFRYKKAVFILFLFLATHGIVNVLIGNDTLSLLIIQLASILFCYIAYSTIISKYSSEELFTTYFKYATFIAVVGVIEEVVGVLNLSALTKLPGLFIYTKYDYRVLGFVKLASLCREPSFLGYILAPAICIILCYYISPELIDKSSSIFKNKLAFAFIIAAYICTFSGVAYSGAFIMLLVLWLKKGVSLKKIILPITILALSVFAYIKIPDIQIRMDDTIKIFSDNTVQSSSVNLSTYTYYSNYTVVQKTIKNTYGLGSGLGSYQLDYERYKPSDWNGSGMHLNNEDANSGFMRILAEIGIIGIILVLYLLIKCFPKGIGPLNGYSVAILCLIIMILIRQGNYIHAGSVMFILMYVKNYDEIETEYKNER